MSDIADQTKSAVAVLLYLYALLIGRVSLKFA